MFRKLGYLGLNGISKRNKPYIYGVKFRDGKDDTPPINGFIYERVGLPGYDINDVVPENLMPVHNKMRRCVVNYHGEVEYYLDFRNSMWKKGSYKETTIANADGTIQVLNSDYGLGIVQITVDETASTTNIGKYINIFDGDSHNFWMALIIGADDNNTYTLSHPHISNWGIVDEGVQLYYIIGDAKLGGQDGNIMVEIPAFWYKYSFEEETGWQEHLISLSKFQGARYYPRRYVAAFEGVSADSNNQPYNGWQGSWDGNNKKWLSVTSTTSPSKIVSVCGYYPKTVYSLDNFRSKCQATGDNYHLYDFVSNFIIQVLMIIEYGTGNMQSKIGKGIADVNSSAWGTYNGYYPVRKTGDTVIAGNGTWDMFSLNEQMQISSQNYRIQSLSYRGIENPYGHIFKWVDGLEFVNNVITNEKQYLFAYAHKSITGGELNINEIITHNNYSALTNDNNYQQLQGINNHPLEILTWLWQSSPEERWIDKSRYWGQASPELLPNDSGASSTGYFYDYFYTPSSTLSDKALRVLAVGGHANYGVLAGAFYVYSYYGSGSTYANSGGRLCLKS